MSSIPALVAEFRAIMADPMGGIPSEAQMRATVEHYASTLPQGGRFYGVWHVEGTTRTLCEFDGCTCYEAYSTAHEAQAEAGRLCLQYGAGRYVSAPVPAGIPCCNHTLDRIEVATGDAGAVRYAMDGGYIVVTLVDASTPDQAIADIEAGLVTSGAIDAPAMVPQQVQQQQANADGLTIIRRAADLASHLLDMCAPFATAADRLATAEELIDKWERRGHISADDAASLYRVAVSTFCGLTGHGA